jgi:cyanophycinase-like exopeptidase
MAEASAPTFLFAGGRGMKMRKGPDPLLQEVFRRANVQRPTVAYVGAASGDSAEFQLWIAGILQKAGAGEVTLAPLCGRRGNAKKAKTVIESSDLVFLSGGDVEEGLRVLNENGMVALLRRLHRSGKVFFGMSAGSIMLAQQWVRWTDPADDATSELFDCLRLAPVLCDTHGEDDAWEELQALLALSEKGAIGYGIVSGTAIVVETEGTVCALGGEVHRFQKQTSGVIRIESLFPDKHAR